MLIFLQRQEKTPPKVHVKWVKHAHTKNQFAQTNLKLLCKFSNNLRGPLTISFRTDVTTNIFFYLNILPTKQEAKQF